MKKKLNGAKEAKPCIISVKRVEKFIRREIKLRNIYNAQRVLISKIINRMKNFVWENIDEMFLTHSHRQRCRATYKENWENKREKERGRRFGGRVLESG